MQTAAVSRPLLCCQIWILQLTTVQFWHKPWSTQGIGAEAFCAPACSQLGLLFLLLIPNVNSRPSQRQRLDAESIATSTDDSRTLTVAPWLYSDEEQTYVSLAGTLLGRFGMTCGFQLGRLKGYHVYGTTVAGTGRECAYGPKHDSNNFFIAFEKSGNVSYHCYGSECQLRQPVCLGQWCSELDAMLASSEMFAPGPNLDAALLQNLKHLALKNTPKKQKISQQPWYDLLERICAYLSHYFVFVSMPAVYVRQTLTVDCLTTSDTQLAS